MARLVFVFDYFMFLNASLRNYVDFDPFIGMNSIRKHMPDIFYVDTSNNSSTHVTIDETRKECNFPHRGKRILDRLN